MRIGRYEVRDRIGLGGGRIPPSGQVCFAVAGSPGDAAVVNLTPVLADSGGYGLLVSSGVAPPVASNVNYGFGTIDPNVAVTPIGPDGQVCFFNSASTSVDLVADHLGTIRGNTPNSLTGTADVRNPMWEDHQARFGAVYNAPWNLVVATNFLTN